MLRFPLFLALWSTLGVGAPIDCVVEHSGRGSARFEIPGTGAYIVDTPHKSQVVVAAREWTHGECARKTCYALLLGLVRNRSAAQAFVDAWHGGVSTWAEVGHRLRPHTTAYASSIPVEFQRQGVGYGTTLKVNRNNSSWLGGNSYEEAVLSCRAK